MKEARAAIAGNAWGFIRPVPGFGYAVSGEAQPAHEPDRTGIFCRLIGQGAELSLAEGDNTQVF